MSQPVPEVVIPAMTYTVLDDVSDSAVDLLLALWLLRPTMDEEQWLALVIDALVSVLAQAEGLGRAYGQVAQTVDGDLALPDEPDGQRRRAPEDFEQRSGIAPAPEETITEQRVEEIREQVHKAVRTLARETPRPATTEEAVNLERIERMVRDETVQQMQRGAQDGIRLAGSATGYRRGVNPGCCELCFWLWKEGYVYPIDQPMHRHTGCRCVPIPTNDPTGRQSRDDLDDAGQALLDRYYAGEFDTTKEKK